MTNTVHFITSHDIMQASDDSEELVLAVDSDKAFLCQEEEGGKLKVQPSLLNLICRLPCD